MARIAKQPNANRPVVKNHWAARMGGGGAARKAYRSGLEDSNAAWMEKHNVPVRFEAIKIRYEVPAAFHTYTPDFVLPNGIIVETKGLFEAADRKKHLMIKEQYPDLDIRFVFQRPSDTLYKGSPTTYAMWSKAKGFQWAFKLVPPEWWAEAGPAVHPEIILAGGNKEPPE